MKIHKSRFKVLNIRADGNCLFRSIGAQIQRNHMDARMDILRFFIMYKKEEMTVPELVSSWAVHYNSWKSFLEKGNGLIIRYEDLINEPLTEFKKILVFLKQFISFEIDEVRLNNAVNTTRFKNIKNMEKTIGFKEKPKTSKEFFRKGQTSEWKKILNPKQIKIIESEFGQEMSDLNYF